MPMYECKLCGHVSDGATHQSATANHRKHFAENHRDGNMYLWSALPRRIAKRETP